MDIFQRISNFIGGKGWVSDEEKRRREQQQAAPLPQPQQPTPKQIARPVNQVPQQPVAQRQNLIQRANDELSTGVNDVNNYYKEDADKLREELHKGNSADQNRIHGLLQSVQNRRKEIAEGRVPAQITTQKKPGFLDYLNPIGEHGLFGSKQQQNFRDTIEKPITNTLKSYDELIDSTDKEKGFQIDSPGDYLRFAAKLPSGMVSGATEAPRKTAEAVSGVRVHENNKVEDINGLQRLGAGADAVLSTAGVGFGGSATAIKGIAGQLGKEATEQGGKILALNGVRQFAKDAAKEGAEEVVQTFAQDLSDDGRVNTSANQYLQSGAFGALGGGMMHGFGRASQSVRNAIQAHKGEGLASPQAVEQTIPNASVALKRAVSQDVAAIEKGNQGVIEYRQKTAGKLENYLVGEATRYHIEQNVRYKLDSKHEAEVRAYNEHIGLLRQQESSLLEQGLSENSAPVINNRKAQAEAIKARDNVGKLDERGVRYRIAQDNNGAYVKGEYSPEFKSNDIAKLQRAAKAYNNNLYKSDTPIANIDGVDVSVMKDSGGKWAYYNPEMKSNRRITVDKLKMTPHQREMIEAAQWNLDSDGNPRLSINKNKDSHPGIEYWAYGVTRFESPDSNQQYTGIVNLGYDSEYQPVYYTIDKIKELPLPPSKEVKNYGGSSDTHTIADETENVNPSVRYSINQAQRKLQKMNDLLARHLQLTGDERVLFNYWRNDMERQAAGYYDPAADAINLNDLTLDTLNHEIAHKVLQRSQKSQQLIAEVRRRVGDDALIARYGDEYGTSDVDLLAEEYIADGFAEYYNGKLLGESDQRLASRLGIPPRLVAIYDRIAQALRSLIGRRNSILEFYEEIEAGEFSQAPYVVDRPVATPVYKIHATSKGKVVEIEGNPLKGVPDRHIPKTVRAIIKERFQGNSYPIGETGNTAKVTARGKSEVGHLREGLKPDQLRARAIAAHQLDELMESMTRVKEVRNLKPDKKPEIVSYTHGDVNIKIGDRWFKVRVNIENWKNGNKTFYDISEIKETSPQRIDLINGGDVTDSNVADLSQNVNNKRFRITEGVQYKPDIKPSREDIDEAIYSLHPELMKQFSTGTIIGKDGAEWGIPRLHVDDLHHHLGALKEDIPAYYRRRDGERNIDIIAQEMGFDDVDEFLDRFVAAIESKHEAKEVRRTIAELRRDIAVLEEAKRIANTPRDEARKELASLLADRQEYLENGDIASVRAADEYIQEVYKQAGAYAKSLPKVKNIPVTGREGKTSEYVAVASDTGQKTETVELIPLDGSRHTLKNGVVVDKDGRYVGSYVGIDEEGNQYAYLGGKPVNITALVGDIGTWGNKNSPILDMDRLIEENAPDQETARKVQNFTTVFKDRQEAAMKADLATRRNKLAEARYNMMKNRPKGVSKEQLSADMFRIMERKIPYNEVVQKYGTEYIEGYIRPVIEHYRKELDEVLVATNKVLVQNGHKPIPRLENYITHIQEDPSFWEKVGLGIQNISQLGSSVSSDVNPGKVRSGIPDEIVGKTANTGVWRKFNQFAQHRKGSAHKQDFFAAIDAYYEPMLFNQYMTPAAARVRVIENVFRTFEKAKQVQFDNLVEKIGLDQAKAKLPTREKTHKKYKAGRNSPLVMAFMEYGNMLAGKTNALDRAAIDHGFKPLVDFSSAAQRITGANLIPGSTTAAISQTLSLPQMIARDSIESVGLAAKDMLMYAKRSNRVDKNDPILKSAFMRARYTDASPMTKNFLRKATDKASVPMEFIERITGEMNWRSAYREAIKKGLKGMDAIAEADIATKKTLAGRGIGDRSVVMNSKALGAFTQFGLEVLNQGVQFTKNFSIGQKFKFMAAAFIMNELANLTWGQRPLPDYIKAIYDTIEDFGGEDELDKDGNPKRDLTDKIASIGQRLAGETAKFIPGSGAIANTFLPKDVKESVFGKDSEVSRFGNPAVSRLAEAGHKAIEGIASGNLGKVVDSGLMVAPMGQQVRRSSAGIETVSDGVARTNDGDIITAVDNNNPFKWVQAGLFGKNALNEIRAGRLQNVKPLTEEQTKIYDEMRQQFGEGAADGYLSDIQKVREVKSELAKAGVSSSPSVSQTAELARTETSIKLKSGEWREEGGLIIDKKGNVQRNHYKTLAQSQGESDEAYDNWMKAYDIDNAGSKQRRQTGNTVLDNLEAERNKTDSVSTAIGLMKDAEKYRELPEWVKDRYYEKNGHSRQEIEYAALASYKPDEKLNAYWLPKAKELSHDRLIQELTNARRESVKGHVLAPNGVLDNLALRGVISREEAATLKKVKFTNDGVQRTSSRVGRGGGRGGNARSVNTAMDAIMQSYRQSLQMSKSISEKASSSRKSAPTGVVRMRQTTLGRQGLRKAHKKPRHNRN